ncbi:MAG: hypothetical protein D6815_09890 [Candidatus Dadabacteria bacterium]|nr:MAG: hypothetical protein D6815_09890 [Candidatus Dadabacteria bacterium]
MKKAVATSVAAACAAAVWICASPALAHELRREIGRAQEAIAVRLYFPGGRPFAYESYEIYRDGEKVPFQVGRSDALGRIVFLPDRPGTWRIRSFSKDGHGADFTVSARAGGSLVASGGPLIERYPRLLVGLGLIGGVFGLAALAALARRRPQSGRGE